MTLFTYLIHNHEKERLDYLRPILSSFSFSVPVIVNEISNQTLGRVNLGQLMQRKLMMQLMRIRWRRHFSTGFTRWDLRELREVIQTLRAFVSVKAFRQEKYRAMVEDVLTRKHFQAIESFCEVAKPGDFILVLESDARIPSLTRLSRCIDHVASSEQKTNLYLLTFPFSINQIEIDPLRFTKKVMSENTTLVYPMPFLNTSAAYLMTYELADMLLAEIKSSTGQLLKPADLLMNHLLIDVWNKYPSTETVIFVPSPIENGSLFGVYSSTIHISSRAKS